MTEDTTHNGWTNYETWAVALWMGNNSAEEAQYWQQLAQETYAGAVGDETFTAEEKAALDLGETLQAAFEDQRPELEGVWADLLNAAFSEVNWYEIARHYVEGLDEA